jgi:hypothetical protein
LTQRRKDAKNLTQRHQVDVIGVARRQGQEEQLAAVGAGAVAGGFRWNGDGMGVAVGGEGDVVLVVHVI